MAVEPDILASIVAANAPALSALVLFAGGLWLGAVSPSTQRECWNAGVARLRSLPFSNSQAVAMIILLLAPHILSQIQILGHPPQPASNVTPQALLVGAAILQLSLLVGVVAVSCRQPQPLLSLYGIDRKRLGRDLLAGCISILRAYPYFLLAALLIMLLQHWGLPIDKQQSVDMLLSHSTPVGFRVALAVGAILVAPIAEEFTFRGILLPVCTRSTNSTVAVLLTSLFFAAAHQNLASFLPLVFVGAAFAIAYIRSGSILVPITMHAIFNGLQILIITQMAQLPTPGA